MKIKESMSTKPTPKERKERTAQLRELHQPIFESLSNPEALYIPKMAHNVKGLEGLHMGFFKSELDHGKDVFTECISMQMESEDPNRTLYRIKFNPFFEEEYATSEPMSNGHVRYYIPLDELEVVGIHGKLKDTLKVENDFNLPNANVDLPLDQMTMRDVAALLLKTPVSEKKWLNEIINNSNYGK